MINIKNYVNNEKQHLDKPMIGRLPKVQMNKNFNECKNNLKTLELIKCNNKLIREVALYGSIGRQ